LALAPFLTGVIVFGGIDFVGIVFVLRDVQPL
jgi:hypothetical protein